MRRYAIGALFYLIVQSPLQEEGIIFSKRLRAHFFCEIHAILIDSYLSLLHCQNLRYC